MPSISHFQIYKPAEPCGLTGENLKQTMEKIIIERLSSNGREFDLKGYCVGSNGMTIFSEDDRLSNVKRLNLGGNRIGDIGAKLLAESPIFCKLQWIEVYSFSDMSVHLIFFCAQDVFFLFYCL